MSAPQLPGPLVAPEVDLRDFGFMPLDVLRLRDSDLMALATGDEFKAAVALWCVAWHQVPAASLPNDDRLLARYSGAGAAWRKVKAEALRGFVECADGRLYHATIAEKAREAWASKQAQRERTRKATEERERRRREAEAQRDGQRNEQRDEQRDVERDVERDVHQGIGTGTVKGQGQGQGDLLPPDGGSGAAASAAPPTPKAQKPQPVPEGIDPRVWSDWLQVRKGKRAGPVTDTAWSGLVREAAKAGITPEAAVRACCEFGWQGFNAGWYVQRKQPTTGSQTIPLSFGERETARKAARYAEMTGGLIGQASTPPAPGDFIDMEPTDGAARLLG